MATYKGIQGYTVQKLATDPTASEAAGQLWYNSTDGAFKISVAGAGAWAAGGNINNGRNNLVSFGTQTACCIAIGAAPAPSLNITETYDGTSWTDGVACLTAREAGAAFGTSTAAINSSGGNIATNESYNGTSWTEVNNMITPTAESAGVGIQTAGMCLGGYRGAPLGYTALSETWDGTCYTEGNDMNDTRNQIDGAGGIVTAAIVAGGTAPPATKKADAETYDGTSWTEVTAMNSARGEMGVSTAGTTTSYLVFGGISPAGAASIIVEEWNGSTWTEVADLATDKKSTQGAGTSVAAINMGGNNAGGKVLTTEEWSDPTYVIKTVTVS